MIDFVLKALLISVFLVIFIQDTKDRMVYWFLYPAAGLLAYLIQAFNNDYILAAINSTINSVLTLTVLLVTYVYSKIIAKKNFVNEGIGIGDILMFIFLSFTFASIAFVILFVFALIFSLALHLIFKKKSQHNNVPLAGYMAIFFASVYMISFFIEPKYLFAF